MSDQITVINNGKTIALNLSTSQHPIALNLVTLSSGGFSLGSKSGGVTPFILDQAIYGIQVQMNELSAITLSALEANVEYTNTIFNELTSVTLSALEANVEYTHTIFNELTAATLLSLSANIAVTSAINDALTAHESDFNNPHQVTKVQVGLSAVDNTSDVNKPISTASQIALDLKTDLTLTNALTGSLNSRIDSLSSTKTDLTLTSSISSNLQSQLNALSSINTIIVSVSSTLNSSLTAHENDFNNPHHVTKTQVGLSAVDNTSDVDKPVSSATLSALNLKINSSLIGSVSGVASLDATGRIPASQLPSYVDEVIEYPTLSALSAVGLGGIIYVVLDTNLVYRWTGSIYVEVSQSIALGELSNTAYRGDRGKIAYDHSQITSGNPHNTTATMVGLSAVDNTSDVNKPVSSATLSALNLKTDLTLTSTLTGNLQSQINNLSASSTFNTIIASVSSTLNSSITAHVADHANPHQVTKAQVGLSAVDNTSDINKPVSTATNTLIAGVSGTLYNSITGNYTTFQAISSTLNNSITATNLTVASISSSVQTQLSSLSAFNIYISPSGNLSGTNVQSALSGLDVRITALSTSAPSTTALASVSSTLQSNINTLNSSVTANYTSLQSTSATLNQSITATNLTVASISSSVQTQLSSLSAFNIYISPTGNLSGSNVQSALSGLDLRITALSTSAPSTTALASISSTLQSNINTLNSSITANYTSLQSTSATLNQSITATNLTVASISSSIQTQLSSLSAFNIYISPSGNLSGSNVQSALSGLDTRINALSSNIAIQNALDLKSDLSLIAALTGTLTTQITAISSGSGNVTTLQSVSSTLNQSITANYTTLQTVSSTLSGYVTIFSLSAPANPLTGWRWVKTDTLAEYTYYSNTWIEVEYAPYTGGSTLSSYGITDAVSYTTIQSVSSALYDIDVYNYTTIQTVSATIISQLSSTSGTLSALSAFQISISNTGNLSGTNVQSALSSLDVRLTTLSTSGGAATTATAVTITNTGNLSGSNVQSALSSLDIRVTTLSTSTLTYTTLASVSSTLQSNINTLNSSVTANYTSLQSTSATLNQSITATNLTVASISSSVQTQLSSLSAFNISISPVGNLSGSNVQSALSSLDIRVTTLSTSVSTNTAVASVSSTLQSNINTLNSSVTANYTALQSTSATLNQSITATNLTVASISSSVQTQLSSLSAFNIYISPSGYLSGSNVQSALSGLDTRINALSSNGSIQSALDLKSDLTLISVLTGSLTTQITAISSGSTSITLIQSVSSTLNQSITSNYTTLQTVSSTIVSQLSSLSASQIVIINTGNLSGSNVQSALSSLDVRITALSSASDTDLYVPYIGAISGINLGAQSLTATNVTILGTSFIAASATTTTASAVANVGTLDKRYDHFGAGLVFSLTLG